MFVFIISSPGRRSTAPDSYFEGKTFTFEIFFILLFNERH